MNCQKTQAELEQQLKHDAVLEREMRDTENTLWVQDFIRRVERIRKERRKVSDGYTQKELAGKAGIALSTYADYVSGLNDNISLKTARNIAHVLGCRLSDLIGEEHSDEEH